ncbi:hypothetical protein [Nocardiopsis kunsanensis]|uniref:hypothetical protein n=1 Tax=Nocardiopsis kunsanensis TaxID=141693 RepID=UPI0003454A42|nr:hypothetical protein [Nocardiopsis kunsanensis]
MAERANRFQKAAESRGTRKTAPEKVDQEPKKATRKKTKRGESARRTDPVRVTVDLDPPAYSQMRRVLLDVAEEADRPTLTAAAMWRALLEEASADPALLARVAKRIGAADTEDS